MLSLKINTMKNYLVLCLMALLAVSCSKKVEVKGKVAGGSPLERIEIIEASSVSTLPLMNIGVNDKGEFSGSFDAPNNGLYVLTYGGGSNVIYLKKGQTLELEGNALSFPNDYKITGDAKANNDFLKAAQTGFEGYALKISMEDLFKKKEDEFLKEFASIKDSILNIMDAEGKKHKADADVVKFKKSEVDARLIGVLEGYAQMHGQVAQDAKYQPSAKFKEVKDGILKNSDQMVRDFPMFREYMLNELMGDFQKYRTNQPAKAPTEELVSQTFAEYLKTRKDLSSVKKDYFLSYVLTQGDLNFMNAPKYDQIKKLIDENVTDSKIKADLHKLQLVLMGHKEGTVPTLKLKDNAGAGKSLEDLKGKPAFVVFYASWNPGIAMTTVPVIAELHNQYGDKLPMVFVNLDDTKEQFAKTSASLFKGIKGTHYWVEGGIASTAASTFGLYGFKIPSYLILDKEGKVASRPFFSLHDPDLPAVLSKLTGVKMPEKTSANGLDPMAMPQGVQENAVPVDSAK